MTTPYKDLAYQCCAHLSDEALGTQAVNVVSREREWDKHWLEGYNTDVFGFRYSLRRMLADAACPRSALVIGSGGAARAVLLGLSQEFPEVQVVVASREPESARIKLRGLLKLFASSECNNMAAAARDLTAFDIVVQATPVGSEKLAGCPLPVPLVFQNGAVVMDLIYAPKRTSFLRYAEQSGARTENGLPMLTAQALESFRLWTGSELSINQAMTNLLPELAVA